MAKTMAEAYKNRILVKRAQMLALTNKYNRAMAAGQKEIEKIASEYQAKQASYRKVIEGLRGLGKQAQQTLHGIGPRVVPGTDLPSPRAERMPDGMLAVKPSDISTTATSGTVTAPVSEAIPRDIYRPSLPADRGRAIANPFSEKGRAALRARAAYNRALRIRNAYDKRIREGMDPRSAFKQTVGI